MLQLDLKALRQYDERALLAFFRLVELNWGHPLLREDVQTLYDQGVRVHIVGGGIRSGSDVSYAFYTERMSRIPHLKWTVRCVSGGGASHHGIGGRRASDLLVAGSMEFGRFTGISSSWTLSVGKGSAEYYFGQYLNDLLLSSIQFEIPGHLERVAN